MTARLLAQIAPISAAYITGNENVRYFSEFTGGRDAGLLLTDRENYILTDSRYFEQAAQECPDFTIVDSTHKENVQSLFGGFNQIGICADELSVSQHSRLPNGPQYADITDHIRPLRMVKAPYQIALLIRAGQIADLALNAALQLMRPGVRECEIAAELEYQFRKHGADGPSFDTIVASGIRSAMPHAAASEKIIAHGDLVVMDFGCKYRGYVSDMTRTVCIGTPTDEQIQAYDSVKKTQQLMQDNIRPGMPCNQADKIARDFLGNQSQYFTHALGHGIGLNVHEAPYTSAKSGDIYREDMITSVEPGLYYPGRFGIRIEDCISITPSGNIPMTHFSKELIIL